MLAKLYGMLLLGLVFLLTLTGNVWAQTRGRANVEDAAGHAVGTASFEETEAGVLITVNVQGLPPGLHAVHVHTVGRCDRPTFTSAGGHFNPLARKHGLKNPSGPHAGDLPDMYINTDGTGRYEVLMESITLRSGEASVFDADGSAIVVHVTADDNVTDPTGNAGDRIACGVIHHADAGKKM